mgnify:CR=1 FL=1
MDPARRIREHFAASAQFLKDQKQIDSVLPDYAPFVDATYAEAAAK